MTPLGNATVGVVLSTPELVAPDVEVTSVSERVEPAPLVESRDVASRYEVVASPAVAADPLAVVVAPDGGALECSLEGARVGAAPVALLDAVEFTNGEPAPEDSPLGADVGELSEVVEFE